MGERADTFLASFNRIDKWMKEELGNPRNMGFSEMVRRLSKRNDLTISRWMEDLLQMAQLRNAIVHEQIGEDFVIAEPNDWTIQRITDIERELLRPEKVLPRFKKKVTGFEITLPITEILKTIAQKKYSQFPLYQSGKFRGLITLRALGYWFAVESLKGEIDLKGRTAEELLLQNEKTVNFRFVSQETTIQEAEGMFHDEATLEAILITKDGNPNGNLLGLIRPRDIFAQVEEK